MPPLILFYSASLTVFAASLLLHRFACFQRKQALNGYLAVGSAFALIWLARHAYVTVLSFVLMLWFAGMTCALFWRIRVRDKDNLIQDMLLLTYSAREWRMLKLGLLGVAALGTLTFARLYVVTPFGVVSSSMYPTLLVGKRYLSSPRVPASEIRRGDIVLIKADTRMMPPDKSFRSSPFNDWFQHLHPSLPNQYEVVLVKRVVAKGGDKVRINRYGVLSVNGQTEQWIEPEKRKDGFIYAIGSLYHQRLRRHANPAADHIIGQENGDCTMEPDGPTETALVCTIPSGRLFVMGDNRDESMDSRYFGSLPEANFAGLVQTD